MSSSVIVGLAEAVRRLVGSSNSLSYLPLFCPLLYFHFDSIIYVHVHFRVGSFQKGNLKLLHHEFSTLYMKNEKKNYKLITMLNDQ